MPVFRLGALRDLFGRTEPAAKEAEPQTVEPKPQASLNLVQMPRPEPSPQLLPMELRPESLREAAAEPAGTPLNLQPQRGARERPVARAVRKPAEASDSYTAADIEVLEGLEPVRRRPGMYIGGTDEKALHHLFAEVMDNAMDEAVAGHASWIDVEYDEKGYLSVSDNGWGIPVDPHPKYKTKSALEIIMTMLHSGAKFNSKVYETSGGLHGVGVSVVNALSSHLEVEVARGQVLYRQSFRRGRPEGPLATVGKVHNRRGTRVRFHPDEQIFGKGAKF